jgi:hypothetical protein
VVLVTHGCVLICQVGPKLFVAFAMQPLLAQVSYAGLDGAAFSYYRTKNGEAKALFTDSSKRWFTQAVDPATGQLVGSDAAVAPAGLRLPNTTQALLASKNGSQVSLGAGWARPHVAMLVFSAPAGDAGVVSSAVAVDDVVGPAGTPRIGFKDRMDVYYAISDKAAGGGVPATAHYRRVVESGQSGHEAVTQAEEMGLFDKVECTASAIDAPEVGQLRAVGRDGMYRVACTNFDVSGVQVVRAQINLYSTPEVAVLSNVF